MASKVDRHWQMTLLGLLVLVALVFPALQCASPSTAKSLPDVPPTSQYADAVNALTQAQVVTGFANGQFGSTTSVIRQQFAKMMALALEIPVSEADASPFTDVPRSSADDLYPDSYIAAVAADHITDGTSVGKFSPEAKISRAQAITMIVRAADNLRPGLLETPPAGYASTWGSSFDPVHGPAAAKAEYNGLLKKLPLAQLNPWGDMSRGEVAQVLANLVVENVKDFGAVGDGAVDDTNALQEAISKAGTIGGGIVYIPAGTYKILAALSVEANGVTLVGDGANSVITASSPIQPEVAISIGGDSPLQNVQVRELSIVGNYAKREQIGIQIIGLTNGTFQDLNIRDTGFCGIYGVPASNVLVDNVTIAHCGDFGIQFKDESQNVTVSNSTLSQFQSRQYPGHGIYFDGVENAVAYGNHITDLPAGTGDENLRHQVLGILGPLLRQHHRGCVRRHFPLPAHAIW
jgi:hypothetical protein